MSKKNNVLIFMLVMFMTCFISLGYAAMSDQLGITGQVTAEGKPYKGVLITDVELIKSNGLIVSDNSFILPTNHTTKLTSVRSDSYATYKITVFNNTDVTYWYVGQRWDTVYDQNSSIGANSGITIVTKDHQNDSSQTFDSNDWVPPQTYREFYVTYHFGSNVPIICSLMVNFHFDIRTPADAIPL